MADRQSRKYLLTIQSPAEKGYSHEVIRDTLATLKVSYWCMADEIAPTTGRIHTHVFLYRKSPIRDGTIRRKFPDIHFDDCIGSCAENRDYVAKIGKWANGPKADTSIPGTFEEFGILPDERQENHPEMYDLITALDNGKSTAEILRLNPKLVFRATQIDIARDTLLADQYHDAQRILTVSYLYGPTGTGKTRSIYDAYPAKEICRITSYGTSASGTKFDAYHGQKVLVFEEFNSQIALSAMLCYLDRYPLNLPARYSDRIACYDTVYITSNYPLQAQYTHEQKYVPEAWKAFLRRLTHIVEFRSDGTTVEHSKEEFIL